MEPCCISIMHPINDSHYHIVCSLPLSPSAVCLAFSLQCCVRASSNGCAKCGEIASSIIIAITSNSRMIVISTRRRAEDIIVPCYVMVAWVASLLATTSIIPHKRSPITRQPKFYLPLSYVIFAQAHFICCILRETQAEGRISDHQFPWRPPPLRNVWTDAPSANAPCINNAMSEAIGVPVAYVSDSLGRGCVNTAHVTRNSFPRYRGIR